MKVALLLVGLAILAAVLWDAGERHYDNCVSVAEQTGAVRPPKGSFTLPRGSGATVERRIAGCSRLPW